MDATAVKEKVNIRIGDSSNFAFTDEQKTEAVEEAFRDPYVVDRVYIDTETFSTSSYRQALPATITTVDNIMYATSTSEFPDDLPGDIWSVRDGYIVWRPNAKYYMRDGATIYLDGWLKLTTTDTINDSLVQEYAINLAIYNTLKGISSQKTYSFTKNDISVGELIAMRNQAEREVEKYKQKFANRAYVAG